MSYQMGCVAHNCYLLPVKGRSWFFCSIVVLLLDKVTSYQMGAVAHNCYLLPVKGRSWFFCSIVLSFSSTDTKA